MPMTQPREITESFRLDRVLKSSRSGIVFRATELDTGRVAAIKLIAPSCPADLHICQEQFLEAMDAWREVAPAVFPALYDFGFTPDGSAFIVMEFIEATPVEALEGLDPARLLNLARECAASLARLAERGTSHGNLTPQNLLVRGAGGKETALVLGFGTAAFRVFMGELTGAVLASDALEYAAPELIDPHAGLGRANARSDIYSLAAVVARLLQAHVSTSSDRTVSVVFSPAVAQALPRSDALRSLLVRMLDPEPERRPATWKEVEVELGALVSPSVSATAPNGSPTLQDEAPAPTGTLFLSLPEPPPAPPAPDEHTSSTPPPPPPPLDEVAEPRPAVSGEAVGAPPPFPHPPERAETETTQPLAALPTATETAPPPYGIERTMAVPVHRLAELPAAPPPASSEAVPAAPQLEPPETPAVPTFGPPSAPPPPVFGGTGVDSTPAALYDTDKGKVAVQPVIPPPPPAPEGVPPLPVPEPEAVSSRLAEPVLEPELEQPVPAPEAAAVPARRAAPPPPTLRRKRTLWPLWLALIVLLLGGGGVGFLWWHSQQKEEEARRRFVPPTPRPPTPVPTAVPMQPPAVLAQIGALEEALAAADLKAAQQILDAIGPHEEGQLPAADREHLQRLRAAYSELRIRTLGNDLVRGLQSGNVRAVQRVMNSLTREDQAALAADPDKAQALEEARRVANVLRLAQAAERSGAWMDLLQQANALKEVVPKAELANELREKAAQGLEAEAAAAAQDGNYEKAIERLAALAKAWPDRPGVQARLERLRSDQEAERKAAAVLAQAEQTESQRQPEKGLALLQSVRPTSRLEARFAELRRRLEALLRQLDAQPPAVELQRGAKLEYEKGKTARLVFIVTDDHGIKSAKLFARVEGGGKYAEISLSRGSGNEWVGEVTAAFHRNENVQFFVVVTDHSEHVGVLGSADKPLLLKRKKVLGIF